MWKLTRLSSLQETKSLATHPLRKKSSEFDLLEIKITRKQKYEGKVEQVLCKIFLLSSITYLIYDLYDRSLFYISSKIYIEKIFSKKYPNNIFD